MLDSFLMKKSAKDIGFVAGQLILFVMLAYPPFSIGILSPSWVKFIGLGFMLVGGLIILVAILQLNTNLSPFPSPKESGTLIQTGLYRYLRHPIYSGILLGGIGWSLFSAHGGRLLVVGLLWMLFYFKARYEEGLLLKQFDTYSAYMKKSGMFVPKLR